MSETSFASSLRWRFQQARGRQIGGLDLPVGPDVPGRDGHGAGKAACRAVRESSASKRSALDRLVASTVETSGDDEFYRGAGALVIPTRPMPSSSAVAGSGTTAPSTTKQTFVQPPLIQLPALEKKKDGGRRSHGWTGRRGWW